jgi:hypothetical protein
MMLNCGTCTGNEVCGGGGANKCGAAQCVPKTCASLSLTCGDAPNGCGGTLHCGTCAPPKTCGGGGFPNNCGCSPTTCDQLGANCGTPSDGCGGLLDCGKCNGAMKVCTATFVCQKM